MTQKSEPTTTLVDISDASFEQRVLRQLRPSVVTFWARWNNPSQTQYALIQEVAKTYSADEGIQVVGMNVDESPMISTQYEFDTLPALVLIHQGSVVRTHSGMASKATIKAMLDEAVALAERIITTDTFS